MKNKNTRRLNNKNARIRRIQNTETSGVVRTTGRDDGLFIEATYKNPVNNGFYGPQRSNMTGLMIDLPDGQQIVFNGHQARTIYRVLASSVFDR